MRRIQSVVGEALGQFAVQQSYGPMTTRIDNPYSCSSPCRPVTSGGCKCQNYQGTFINCNCPVPGSSGFSVLASSPADSFKNNCVTGGGYTRTTYSEDGKSFVVKCCKMTVARRSPGGLFLLAAAREICGSGIVYNQSGNPI